MKGAVMNALVAMPIPELKVGTEIYFRNKNGKKPVTLAGYVVTFEPRGYRGMPRATIRTERASDYSIVFDAESGGWRRYGTDGFRGRIVHEIYDPGPGAFAAESGLQPAFAF